MNNYKATEVYGEEGIAVKEFNSFQDIPSKYISDKNEWLNEQEIKFTSENLQEKWVLILLENGGSCISPKSKLCNIKPNDSIPHERK